MCAYEWFFDLPLTKGFLIYLLMMLRRFVCRHVILARFVQRENTRSRRQGQRKGDDRMLLRSPEGEYNESDPPCATWTEPLRCDERG